MNPISNQNSRHLQVCLADYGYQCGHKVPASQRRNTKPCIRQLPDHLEERGTNLARHHVGSFGSNFIQGACYGNY